MGRKVWSETDHFFHQQRLRMSPMIRLKMLATWAAFSADFTYFGTSEELAPLFEAQFAHDRWVIGWVDDCPEVPPVGSKS